MKTKLLFLFVLFLGISLGLLQAQSDEKRERRPFAECIYGEFNFGLGITELTHWMSNLAVGYRITPNFYMGIEYMPGFGSRNTGRRYRVNNGWGLKPQLRLGKWYAFASTGYLGNAAYGNDAAQRVVSDHIPDHFSYFRYGLKYCFNQRFSLGLQYAVSDYFTGYYTENPPEVGEPVSHWSYRVECFTINIGVMIQKVPKKNRKN